jgi:hypothetical protein
LLYDVVLIPAILLLEWHYVVDLLGGVVVAALAIALNRGPKGEGDLPGPGVGAAVREGTLESRAN